MTIIDTTLMIALLKGAPETVKKINEIIEKNGLIVVTAPRFTNCLKSPHFQPDAKKT